MSWHRHGNRPLHAYLGFLSAGSLVLGPVKPRSSGGDSPLLGEGFTTEKSHPTTITTHYGVRMSKVHVATSRSINQSILSCGDTSAQYSHQAGVIPSPLSITQTVSAGLDPLVVDGMGMTTAHVVAATVHLHCSSGTHEMTD